uniref:Uncharacterized protein n=1 Tax=Meloidogyne enterolobii TaxID=390850 RepID=A0A6V7VQB5_MELEN|nr:unnamed protein product [Meloidogyne enterolobii]
MSTEQQNINNLTKNIKIIKNKNRILHKYLNNSTSFYGNLFILLISLLFLTKMVKSTTEINNSKNSIESEDVSSDTCDIHANDSLHALMDRICELCHDMYSHQQPNMRADCRSDCFRNNNFKRCLRLFKPTGRSSAQRHRMRFLEESLHSFLIA